MITFYLPYLAVIYTFSIKVYPKYKIFFKMSLIILGKPNIQVFVVNTSYTIPPFIVFSIPS